MSLNRSGFVRQRWGWVLALLVVAVAAVVLWPRPSLPRTSIVERLAAEGPPERPFNSNPGYMGPQVCAECHRPRFEEFQTTRHFKACVAVTPELMPPGAGDETFTAPKRIPGMEIQVRSNGSGFEERVIRDTIVTRAVETFPISLMYGSGGMGDEVYFSQSGEKIVELPLVWLRPQQTWGVQSFVDELDPTTSSRPATNRCLECHNTFFEQRTGSVNEYRPDSFILGVTCECCHGPAREHVVFHRKHPETKQAVNILHPGKLSRDKQVSICAQCHASAVYRKTPLFAHRPGTPVEESFHLFVDDGIENDHVADQVKYLGQSTCFQQSGTLTCTTCHSPHHRTSPEESGREACVKCHQPESCGRRASLPEAVQDRCVDCHMPRYNRVAVRFHTHDDLYVPPMRPRQHRIGIYPEADQTVMLDWYREQNDAESQAAAQRLESELVAYWRSEAKKQEAAGRLLTAIGSLREAHRIQGSPEVQQELAAVTTKLNLIEEGMCEGVHLVQQKQNPAAIKAFQKVISLKPNHAQAHGRLGTVLAMSGQLNPAIEELKKVVEFDPNDAYGENMAGWLHYLNGQPDVARGELERADGIYPFTPDINYRWGLALLRQEQWKDAEAKFRKSLLVDPLDAGAWYGLNLALRGQGQSEEAILCAEQAVRITRLENLELLIGLSEAYHEAGRIEDDAAVLLRAIEVARVQNPALVGRLRGRLDTLEAEAGRKFSRSP